MGSFSSSAFATDAFDTDSWDFGVISTSLSDYSEGTLVVSGVVQVRVVANSYTPVSTDVYILGTLHNSDGAMYVTEGTIVGSGDVFINSILHTSSGVRYITLDDAGGHSNGENFVTKGFVVDDDGRQYCESSGTGNYEHSILRDDDASPSDMLVTSV